MKFDYLTDDDISVITDVRNSREFVAESLGIGLATVSRWRKKLGANISRGRKSANNGGTYVDNGFYKPCPVCGGDVYYQPRQVDMIKCCSIKCLHNYDVYNKKLRDNVGSRINNSRPLKPETDEYTRYKNRVHKLSDITYNKYKEIINPHNHPRCRCGVEGGYQLDHIITVRESFDNNIPEAEVAVLSNLRMLPWQENLSRNKSIS